MWKCKRVRRPARIPIGVVERDGRYFKDKSEISLTSSRCEGEKEIHKLQKENENIKMLYLKTRKALSDNCSMCEYNASKEDLFICNAQDCPIKLFLKELNEY